MEITPPESFAGSVKKPLNIPTHTHASSRPSSNTSTSHTYRDKTARSVNTSSESSSSDSSYTPPSLGDCSTPLSHSYAILCLSSGNSPSHGATRASRRPLRPSQSRVLDQLPSQARRKRFRERERHTYISNPPDNSNNSQTNPTNINHQQ
jgi:hypothetical protein